MESGPRFFHLIIISYLHFVISGSKDTSSFSSILSESNFRLISNTSSLDISLWISKLEFVLKETNNGIEFTLVNLEHDNPGDFHVKIVTSAFSEHFILISCNSLAQFQNLIASRFGGLLGKSVLARFNQTIPFY